MSAKKANAAALSQCPLDGCKARPEPIFCALHWAKISGSTRRALVGEFRALQGMGIGDVPKRLGELLVMAVREAG